jgi:outer membrane murein-binding lipoprotein Lpp
LPGGLLVGILVITGCVSQRKTNEFSQSLAETIAAPFNALSRQISGAQDLAYATAAFHRKNKRWPKDYSEMLEFVEQSDGYLQLQDYERIDFIESAAGGLSINYVLSGLTNTIEWSGGDGQPRR